MKKSDYATIDQYIRTFPEPIQAALEKLRRTVQKAAPDAAEAISYRMPTFKLKGNLVHFAAFKDHYSLFPGASGVAAFKKYLSRYRTSKGTIQFPQDKPLPLPLIARIVKYRVKENLDRAGPKTRKKA